jgi:hypothetical protein
VVGELVEFANIGRKPDLGVSSPEAEQSPGGRDKGRQAFLQVFKDQRVDAQRT